MKALMNWIEKYLAPAGAKLSEQRHLGAIRDGLAMTMSFLIIGSLVLVVLNIPIPGWRDLWVIKQIVPYGVFIYNGTMAIVSLLAAFGIGSSLSQKYKMDGTIGGLMAIAGLITITPTLKDAYGIGYPGAGWLFTAMIFSILAVEIMHFFVSRKIVIKMPDGVPPAVAKSFSALIPGIAVLVLFSLIRGILEFKFGLGVNDLIVKIFMPLKFVGGSLAGALLAVVLVHLLWAVGIHGGTIALAVFGPFFLEAATKNSEAFAAGQAIPNIVTAPFLDIFVYIGGAGSTISLALLMFFISKSKQMKALGRLSIAPALFNINEPILFGTPMITNPVLIVPFILTPVTLCLVSYAAMATGLVAKTAVVAPWTSPFIMGGWISTADWRGAVLQLINVGIGLAIYFPFFRAWDKLKLQEEKDAAAKAA